MIKSMIASPSQNSIMIDRRGLMLVLSSPSGAGKSTIARQLLGDCVALDVLPVLKDVYDGLDGARGVSTTTTVMNNKGAAC